MGRGGLVLVAGRDVTVGGVVAARVGPCVGVSAAVAVGFGDGGTLVAVNEAVGKGGIGVGVLVGSDVGEPEAMEADSGVEEPNGERHAVKKLPTAANPRLTKRRLDMRPNTVVSGSLPDFTSLSGFTFPPVSLASLTSEPSYGQVLTPAGDRESVQIAA